jgi:hypothetical protein
MRLALILTLALSLSACRLPKQLTQPQVLTIIADTLYGIDLACYSEWLDGTACLVVYRILNDATALVIGLQSGWQGAAKAVIIKEEALLPADSRIRPYLDAAISVL